MKNPNINLCLYNFNIPKFQFYCKFCDDTDNTTVLKWKKRKRKKQISNETTGILTLSHVCLFLLQSG